MNATTTSTRKTVKKPVLTEEQKAYIATLSPKHRKLWLLTLPLKGKLTKALAIK